MIVVLNTIHDSIFILIVNNMLPRPDHCPFPWFGPDGNTPGAEPARQRNQLAFRADWHYHQFNLPAPVTSDACNLNAYRFPGARSQASSRVFHPVDRTHRRQHHRGGLLLFPRRLARASQ